MLRKLFAWTNRYERHLSAAAMLAGFAWDNIFFGRIDVFRTQVVFLAYTVICLVTIPLLHAIEVRGERTGRRPSWRGVVPIVTQFALGGFWSGFVIFYGRSAVLSASWPFLLVLLAILLGNEVFKKYHERLVFTSVLFFFALYSYAIFALPIYTGTMGAETFLESGLLAVGAFALFVLLLALIGRKRFRADFRRITLGTTAVLVVLNLSYFTNILPPLPLSAKAVGIYHAVWRVSDGYLATNETEPWAVRYLGFTPTMHVVSGDSLYAYAAVFAPTKLSTTIIHQWQWYDPATSAWVTKAAVSYPIQGGRDGGYRGYSAVLMTEAGRWRVNIETAGGLIIARLPFTVDLVQLPPVETTGLLEK